MVERDSVRRDPSGRPVGAGPTAPTLDFLCRSLGLRLVNCAAHHADRPVRGVWQAGPTLAPPPPGDDLRNLVIVPPDPAPGARLPDADRFVRRLAERGAAALALPAPRTPPTQPPDEPTEPLARAAERQALPVLLVPEGVGWATIAQAIGDERCRLAEAEAAAAGAVLAQLRFPPDRPGAVQRLAEWLAGVVGGAVTVTAGNGKPLAGAPTDAWQVLAPMAQTAARVAERRLGSAVVDSGPWQVRLLPVGDGVPGPVLAVALPRPAGRPAPAVTGAIGHATDVLPLLLRVQEANAYERRTRHALSAARLGVLQMLMGGQLLLAQRTAAAVAPGLLDADEGRVLIISGRPADRAGLVEQCEEATQGRALVVRCPIYDTDVIIVAPVPSRKADNWATDCARLRDLVAADPRRRMGGSGPTPLGAAASAYQEAQHALAAADHLPDRVVLHSPETGLAQVLGTGAYAWARAVLRPLLALPGTEREPLLDTLRLVLAFGVAGASRITGRHRNTVSATRRRVADLLRLDLGDVLARARLDLALRVSARTVADAPADAPVPFTDLLATEAARQWSRRWLAPLDQDARDLRYTLAVWLGHNTHVERTADTLELYPDTVRERLRTAGTLLHRDLMSPDGPHDPALALLACRALPAPAEPPLTG